MDLGIWSNRLADAVFTLDEFGSPEPLAGLSNQPLNVVMGDKARRWSRMRVHRHFFPHYVDQPPTFAPAKSDEGQDWSSEKIDYVMLSALSSSPTQLYYLPTKAGIPARDKAEIRKWLDWGRKNIRYLQVRKDLPQWPEAGKVDGNAHIIGDRGLIFLFNPNPTTLPGKFRLDRESIGLTGGAVLRLWRPTLPRRPSSKQIMARRSRGRFQLRVVWCFRSTRRSVKSTLGDRSRARLLRQQGGWKRRIGAQRSRGQQNDCLRFARMF